MLKDKDKSQSAAKTEPYRMRLPGFVRDEALTADKLAGRPILLQQHLFEKSFVRIDVTEEFSFLVTKLSPYFYCEVGSVK